MNDNHLEFDQIYNQMCGHIEWSDELYSINQPHSVKITTKEDDYFDFNQLINNNSTQQTHQMNDNNVNLIQVDNDPNPNHEKGNNIFDSKNNNKTKFITKSNCESYLKQSKIKAKLKTNAKSILNCNSLLEQKNIRKKSKFNNMGSYLISTFSDILNIKNNYRFLNGVYQIFIHSNWIQIGIINCYDVLMIEKEMALLKFKLSILPRKQGSKKDLFQILNDYDCDSEEVKLCKLLIRKEILYSLGQREWLLQHAHSRDFKPENDDRFGTKKQQRHQAYLSYLIAIEFSLRTKNKLTKRISI